MPPSKTESIMGLDKWITGTVKLAKVDSRAWLNLGSARLREYTHNLWGTWMMEPHIPHGKIHSLQGVCEATKCSRYGRFFVPDSVKFPAPLVVMLHGCFQDAQSLSRLTRMDALARERGFCVLYPQQTERAHPLRAWGWNQGEHQGRQGEPAAIANMLEKAARWCGASPAMVSVSGISAGGAMAASLACLYPELMGSVALVGAPMPYADRSSDEALEEMRCGPSAGVKTAAQQAMRAAKQHAQAPECLPVLVVHGLKDTVVHAQHAMGHEQAFLGLNEALGSAQGPAIPVQKDSKQAMARLWRNSKGSVIGALLAPSDLGHAWSGGNPSEPFSQEGFDQSRLIIDFFEAARSRNWNLFEPEVLTSRLVAEKKIASFKRKAFKSGP